MRQILLPDELNIERFRPSQRLKPCCSGAGPGAKAVHEVGLEVGARVERFEVCIFTSM